MPFKSKNQVKACFAKKDPKWDCDKWAKETPDMGSLPKKAKPMKAMKTPKAMKPMKQMAKPVRKK